MKVMKSIHLLVGLIILLGTLGIGVRNVSAKPTIHALLIVMDGDARDPERYEIDYKRIQPLLRDVQDQGICDLKLTPLRSKSEDDSKRPTRARVLEWIDNVNPRPNDVIFVYFAGHGNRDDIGKNDGTFLGLVGSEKLYREDLINAMKASAAWSCRLQILITDTCSGNGRGETKLNTSPTFDYNKVGAFRNLFLQHEGFLHIASASPGEVAFGDTQNGGWFTTGLVGAIYSHEDAAKRFVGWNEIFTSASESVQKFIREMPAAQREDFERQNIRIQQTPKDYQFPKPLRDPGALARWEIMDDDHQSLPEHTQGSAGIREITLSLTEVTDERPLQDLQLDIQFSVSNPRDEKVKVLAYFFHEDGRILKDLDSETAKRYGTVNGQVVTGTQVKAGSNEATLRIPVRQLHLRKKGEYALEVVVVVRSIGGEELIRGRKSFEYTVH